MDVFDRSTQTGLLPDVCAEHSHVLLAGERIREARVPVAQLVLMWVSANMPGLADRILASARTHYFGEPLTTASI